MRKCIKIIFVILIIILIGMHSVVYAGVLDDVKDFMSAGSGNPQGTDTTTMKNNINSIAGLLTGIGVIAAIAVGAVLGIQFMMGSTEEQAKVKESLIPYVVGCIVVFGAARNMGSSS